MGFKFKRKLKNSRNETREKVTTVKMFILYFNRYDVINYISLAGLKIEFCFFLQLIQRFFDLEYFVKSQPYNVSYLQIYQQRSLFFKDEYISLNGVKCTLYCILIQSNALRCRPKKGPYIFLLVLFLYL